MVTYIPYMQEGPQNHKNLHKNKALLTKYKNTTYKNKMSNKIYVMSKAKRVNNCVFSCTSTLDRNSLFVKYTYLYYV